MRAYEAVDSTARCGMELLDQVGRASVPGIRCGGGGLAGALQTPYGKTGSSDHDCSNSWCETNLWTGRVKS